MLARHGGATEAPQAGVALADIAERLVKEDRLRPAFLFEECAVTRLDDDALRADPVLAALDPELDVLTIAADLAARGLPVLRSALGNRAGFAHAFAAGLGVTEAAPRSTAAAELRALLDELRELTE